MTSTLSNATYCTSQVTIKLRETGFDNDQMVALATDPERPEPSPADCELVRCTTKLSKALSSVTEEDIERLRSHGFSDLDIVDANSQCAHLNYAKRVSHGIPQDRPVEAEND